MKSFTAFVRRGRTHIDSPAPVGLSLAPAQAASERGEQPIFRLSAVPRRKFHTGFSTRETRHNFVIAMLPKAGWFKPQGYLYTCMRCKAAFRVNDPRGSIIPIDELGRIVAEPEASRRAADFAEGPCDAFLTLANGASSKGNNEKSASRAPKPSRLAS